MLWHHMDILASAAPVLWWQGRGASTGYDNAVALPARADDEELVKENIKSAAASKGECIEHGVGWETP